MCAAFVPPRPDECPIGMSDGSQCRRPVYDAPAGVDPIPVCLMHSKDPQKDAQLFRRTVDALMSVQAGRHDFSYFVFPELNFRERIFPLDIYFHQATFLRHADFSGAKFLASVVFSLSTFSQEAQFSGASFGPPPASPLAAVGMPPKGVAFRETKFRGNAHFLGATFWQEADFTEAVFGMRTDDVSAEGKAIADFRKARFHTPERVSFYQVNRNSSQGFLVRLVDCQIEGIHFQDVNWARDRGRMVLQDELDVRAKAQETTETDAQAFFGPRHDLVAIAYRRLLCNFEGVRAYDLAEDAFCGAMEMRRRDPRYFYFARYKRVLNFYIKHPRASWVIRQLSLTSLYKLLSNYGSSYKRALACLLGFLLLFAALSPCFGLRMAGHVKSRAEPPGAPVYSAEGNAFSWQTAWRHSARSRELWRTAKAGFWAAAEVAAFQKYPTVEPASDYGRRLAVGEILVMPGQLALFLLALRRRFRR